MGGPRKFVLCRGSGLVWMNARRRPFAAGNSCRTMMRRAEPFRHGSPSKRSSGCSRQFLFCCSLAHAHSKRHTPPTSTCVRRPVCVKQGAPSSSPWPRQAACSRLRIDGSSPNIRQLLRLLQSPRKLRTRRRFTPIRKLRLSQNELCCSETRRNSAKGLSGFTSSPVSCTKKYRRPRPPTCSPSTWSRKLNKLKNSPRCSRTEPRADRQSRSSGASHLSSQARIRDGELLPFGFPFLIRFRNEKSSRFHHERRHRRPFLCVRSAGAGRFRRTRNHRAHHAHGSTPGASAAIHILYTHKKLLGHCEGSR